MQSAFFILFLIQLYDNQCVVWEQNKSINESEVAFDSFLHLSKFSKVAPSLKFNYMREPHSVIPNFIQKEIQWGPTLRSYDIWITHAVIQHGGFKIAQTSNSDFPTMASFDLYDSSNDKLDKLNHVFEKPYEKVNHLPNINELDDKDKLSNNLKKFSKKHGDQNFPFIIPTYVIPEENSEFISKFHSLSQKLWVQKPSNLSDSIGIAFFNELGNYKKDWYSVVQKYIENPMTIDGRKSEIRKYALLTGFDPIKIFTFSESLVKVSAKEFTTDFKYLKDTCVHTPYFMECQEQGLEWVKTSFIVNEEEIKSNMAKQGINWRKIEAKINDAIIKIVLSVTDSIRAESYKTMKNRYNAYNLMAFDFFVDKNSNIWLNEINRRPGLSPYAHHKIWDVIADSLNIAGYNLPPFLSPSSKNHIQKAYNLPSDPTFNPNFYSFNLNGAEIKKQAYFENNYEINDVESYGRQILENLTGDDIRVLMTAEDELERMSQKSKRIYPSTTMGNYNQFVECKSEKCYYFMLFNAWEKFYGRNRKNGIKRLEEESHKYY